MADPLAEILVEIGVDMDPLRRGMKQGVSVAKTGGDSAGNAWSSAFGSPVLRTFSMLGDAAQGVRDTLGTLGNLSGSQFAAEIAGYRRSLQYISGDARTAQKALDSFMNTAGSSQFDAGAVAKFGLNLAGRTGDVTGAARDTQYAVDAAQVIGVDRAHFDAFQTNLAQIQNRGNSKVEMPDLQQLRDYAPMLTAAVAKSLNISVAEASKRIAGASGNQLSDMILGLGRTNAGAAARASGSDPYAVAANTVDDFNKAMLPTGEIINAALLPLAQGAQWLTQRFGDLNNATGGGAGLIVTIGGAVVVGRQLMGGFLATTTAAGEAALALRVLAASAGGASVGKGIGAASSAVGGGGLKSLLGGGSVAALIANPVADAVALAVAMTVGGIYAEAYGRDMEKSQDVSTRKQGTFFRSVGEYGRKFGNAGMYLPSTIPGVNAFSLQGIGMGIGGIAGIVKASQIREGGEDKKTPQPKTEIQKLTDALNKNTAATEKARFTVYGGGERTRRMMGDLEMEYMIMRSMETGFA